VDPDEPAHGRGRPTRHLRRRLDLPRRAGRRPRPGHLEGPQARLPQRRPRVGRTPACPRGPAGVVPRLPGLLLLPPRWPTRRTCGRIRRRRRQAARIDLPEAEPAPAAAVPGTSVAGPARPVERRAHHCLTALDYVGRCPNRCGAAARTGPPQHGDRARRATTARPATPRRRGVAVHWATGAAARRDRGDRRRPGAARRSAHHRHRARRGRDRVRRLRPQLSGGSGNIEPATAPSAEPIIRRSCVSGSSSTHATAGGTRSD
jgi:hypothetical protein